MVTRLDNTPGDREYESKSPENLEIFKSVKLFLLYLESGNGSRINFRKISRKTSQIRLFVSKQDIDSGR
jgi:hypothetical protein